VNRLVRRRRGTSAVQLGRAMKPLKPADYLDDPRRAIAQFNRVIAGGGDLEAVKQALSLLSLALRRAGFGRADDHGCIRNPD
jgi:hypothetical protein